MTHHSSVAANKYLEEALTPRQMKRLERKAERQVTQAHKSTELPSNVASLIKREEPKPLLPKTENQKQLLDQLRDFDQIFAIGPAGTGKTYVVAAYAADQFRFGKIKKIVLTRPNVPTGKSVGLFPGTLEEKMAVWLAPLTSVIKERIGQGAFEIALKRGDIVFQPLETIRGASYESAFILFDEVQNATFDELTAVVTRLGQNSKLVLSGDFKQTDIGLSSGLQRLLDIVTKNPSLQALTGTTRFTSADVIRSGLCKEWVIALEKE